MLYGRSYQSSPRGGGNTLLRRIRAFRICFAVVMFAVIARLFVLQVVEHGFYQALAAGQHDLTLKLFPRRGQILLRDHKEPGKLYPVATNREAFLVYADPREVTNASSTAQALSPLLDLPATELFDKLGKRDDPYEPLKHRVDEATANQIRAQHIPGIGFAQESVRTYPDQGIGGHLLGFVGSDASGAMRGRYGVEGAEDQELAGKLGEIVGERDIAGRWIPVARQTFVSAVDGADLVLTVDRTVQYVACAKLRAAVSRHGADGGTVVILDPATGEIIALCSVPDYDPNGYNTITDASVFLDPAILGTYEPGSVMKPMTMAAAIDAGAVSPSTTYVDTGRVEIGGFTINNSDNKSYGTQTMAEVLEKSLNTGAIFAMKSIGPARFRAALEAFGFGKKSGVEIGPEAAGNLGEVGTGGEIYAMTAAYGQGITATPLQLAAAYASLANNGVLMRPHLVAEIRRSDGTIVTTKPEEVRRVVSERTATLLGGMLTGVVERGHGKRAGVPGYYVAGKTGTAQIPNPHGAGYLPDAHIGSFVGFAPVAHPRFVMAVKIDRPRDVNFAESSAAPLFGEIAQFLLQYYDVPPER